MYAKYADYIVHEVGNFPNTAEKHLDERPECNLRVLPKVIEECAEVVHQSGEQILNGDGDILEPDPCVVDCRAEAGKEIHHGDPEILEQGDDDIDAADHLLEEDQHE